MRCAAVWALTTVLVSGSGMLIWAATGPQAPVQAADSQAEARALEVEGAMTAWDIQAISQRIRSHTALLGPLLERTNPKQWSRQETAASYQAQWEYCRNEIRYLGDVLAKFEKRPESLPLGLESYLRLESLTASLRSFVEGVRRSYNPAVAELLEPAVAQLGEDQKALGQYILSLAQQREELFDIMNREAQRCRSLLTAPGARR